MRSELVFGAIAHISNQYQLQGVVSQGTRKLHRPKTRCRIQRTLCLSNYITGARSLIADVTGVSTFSTAPRSASTRSCPTKFLSR
jgi:hypothetical protein